VLEIALLVEKFILTVSMTEFGEDNSVIVVVVLMTV